MAIDREKLARLEARTEAMNAQRIALGEIRYAHVTAARQLLAQAVSNASEVAHLRLEALNHFDPTELKELGVDLNCLREANLEMVGAAEVQMRLDAESQATHPMRVLIDKLRRYAREGVTFSD